MYSAGAFGCVAAGLYWKKANRVGAMASLILGAIAPALFLILEKSHKALPSWALFLVDVNVSGFLSFLLAASGMIAGPLLTQKTHPPTSLPESGTEDRWTLQLGFG